MTQNVVFVFKDIPEDEAFVLVKKKNPFIRPLENYFFKTPNGNLIRNAMCYQTIEFTFDSVPNWLPFFDQNCTMDVYKQILKHSYKMKETDTLCAYIFSSYVSPLLSELQ